MTFCHAAATPGRLPVIQQAVAFAAICHDDKMETFLFTDIRSLIKVTIVKLGRETKSLRPDTDASPQTFAASNPQAKTDGGPPVKTVTPTPEEMKSRTARFKDLVPYSKQQENTGIPVAAMERLTANKVYPVMVPAGYKGRSSMAPLKGLPGAVVSIAECPAGDGPGLHAHEQTVENFFCLNGRFEVTWGRSDARRGGKECGRTCRSRGSPD